MSDIDNPKAAQEWKVTFFSPFTDYIHIEVEALNENLALHFARMSLMHDGYDIRSLSHIKTEQIA